MNFYKHYVGDFKRDTSHLSMTERGAYLSLIHHYYATENCLPDDHTALCRIAGAMTKPERDAVRNVMCFFESKPEGLWHKRIEAELGKCDGVRDKNKEIALAREEKKRAARLERTKQETSTQTTTSDHEQSTKRAKSVDEPLHENSTIPDTIARHQTKQSSVDDVGVSDKPCPVIPINQSLDHAEKFPMDFDWCPSVEFEKNLPGSLCARKIGDTVRDLAEFISYRRTTGEVFSQAEWEHLFLKNIEANMRHRGQA